MPDPSLQAPDAPASAMVSAGHPTPEHSGEIAPGDKSAIEDFRTERVCPRCRYAIYPGYWHEEQPQPEGASHVVCNLRSANGAILRGPLTEVISKYLDEEASDGSTE